MVKYFHKQMPGAPVLSGTAGALIAILDACLVDGFGLKTVDSVVVAGGVATMTISTGMTFEADAVVLIAGITGGAAALNGDQRLLSVAGNTATFDAAGVSDQTATGTISAKMSPLGWAKPFSGTNVAAYKPTDPTALGMYLRVDDTGTTATRVVGYESMSDINTGTGRYPTDAQISGGGYWEKSSSAGSTAHNWFVAGDERAFLLWMVPNGGTSVTSQGIIRGFFDLVPRRTTDAYANVLHANVGTWNYTNSTDCGDLGASFYNGGQHGPLLPRDQTGLGGAIIGFQLAESKRGATTTWTRSGKPTTAIPPYPNPADNGLDLERLLICEQNYGVRGAVPGLLHAIQDIGFVFTSFDRLAGQGALSGRKVIALRTGSAMYGTQNSTSGYYGTVFVDITGPWR